MRSIFFVVYSIVFAFAVLAATGGQLLNRRNIVPVTVDSSYSHGAVTIITGVDGDFDFASATLLIPDITGPTNASTLSFVGLDGYTCDNVGLAAGVQLLINNQGNPAYQTWWSFDNEPHSSGMSISARDAINIAVSAFGPNKGVVSITNVNTTVNEIHTAQLQAPLCRSSASWGVQTPNSGPMLNFGTLVLADVEADGRVKMDVSGLIAAGARREYHGRHGSVPPVMTSFSGSDIIIQYLGP